MQFKNIQLLPSLFRDYWKLKKQLRSNSGFKIAKFFPILGDKQDSGGLISGHYFHQDLLVANFIATNKDFKYKTLKKKKNEKKNKYSKVESA